MRYTEARLRKIAEEMLADLDKETVDLSLNFDDSLKEPFVASSANKPETLILADFKPGKISLNPALVFVVISRMSVVNEMLHSVTWSITTSLSSVVPKKTRMELLFMMPVVWAITL